MEKQSSKNKKNALIIECLLILIKHSDELHHLSAKEIRNYLKAEFNDDVSRQTIANYIHVYNDLDIEIKKSGRGYYYSGRLFTNEEIEILCLSIMANSTIPLNYSVELISKLKTMQGEYFGNDSDLEFNINNIDKRDNKDLFLNIEVISEAINKRIQISFDYLKYDNNLKLVKRGDKRYFALPLRIVSLQGRFYLVSYNLKYNDYQHFRVDKMQNIVPENKVRKKHTLDNSYVKHRLYMQSGDINEYKIKIKSNMLDEVVDLFGKNIHISKTHDEDLVIELKSTKQGIIYFACQYINYVEVLTPVSTRKEIGELLKEAINRYGGN